MSKYHVSKPSKYIQNFNTNIKPCKLYGIKINRKKTSNNSKVMGSPDKKVQLHRKFQKEKTKNRTNLPAFQGAKIHGGEVLSHPCKNLHPGFELYPPTLILTSLCHPIEV